MPILRPRRYQFYVAIPLIALAYVLSVSHMPQGLADFFMVTGLNVVACISLLNALAAKAQQPTVERALSLALLLLSAGSVLLLTLEVHLRGFSSR